MYQVKQQAADVEIHSVISEEEEGIMSTGRDDEEDGINQSFVYPSSIRSVTRKPEEFKSSKASKFGEYRETEAVQIIDSISNHSLERG